MIKTLRKQVLSGLCLALLLATLFLATPTPVLATGQGTQHCHFVCCLYVSGWCVWTGCIECVDIGVPFPQPTP